MKFTLKETVLFLVVFVAALLFGQGFTTSIVAAFGVAGQALGILADALLGFIVLAVVKWAHIL